MKALLVLDDAYTGTEAPGPVLVSQLTAIANQPMLRYWLRNLCDAGITEIGVLAGAELPAIAAAFGDGTRYGVALHYLTATRIAEARSFLGADDFVVCRGRSLLPDGIVELVEQFRSARAAVQLVVQKVADPSGCDIVELDADARMTRFAGDAGLASGNLAIVGVYFCTPAAHEALQAVADHPGGIAGMHHAIGWLLDHDRTVDTQHHYGYWQQVSTAKDALAGNRRLLGALRTDLVGEVHESELDGPVTVAAGAVVRRCRITGPVAIGRDSVVEDCELGPNVSVGAGCRVRASSLADSIVLPGTPVVGVRGVRDRVVGKSRTPRSDDRPRQRAVRLRARDDRGTHGLLTGSLAARTGAFLGVDDTVDWLTRHETVHRYQVTRLPLTELDGWWIEPGTGNLVHRNGEFFSVQGLDVSVRTVAPDSYREWQQPIVVQPEIGIVGILAREFDGVLHFLMRATTDPGNAELVQLAPTVQASRGAYPGVHRSTPVPLLEYFTQPGRGRVITDVLQSEHGSWFCHKVNRNMIIAVDEDVPVGPDHCWLTLGQLGRLLNRDNTLAMAARNVLACVPPVRPATVALHSDTELLSWLTAEQSRYDIRARRIPLDAVHGWRRDTWSIGHERGHHFRVVGVAVTSGDQRVPAWTQPLVAPTGQGVSAFVLRRIGGVPHLLVHARATGGLLDRVELGPTVQCLPGHYANGDAPPFLDLVRNAGADRIRYSAVQSEDGSRLLDAENRYLIVEATETEAPTQPQPGYQWATAGQLSALLRHSNHVNGQARTLLAAMTTGAANRCG